MNTKNSQSNKAHRFKFYLTFKIGLENPNKNITHG